MNEDDDDDDNDKMVINSTNNEMVLDGWPPLIDQISKIFDHIVFINYDFFFYF